MYAPLDNECVFNRNKVLETLVANNQIGYRIPVAII